MQSRVSLIPFTLTIAAMTGGIAAQKHPAPGDAKRNIEVFDVRDIVGSYAPEEAAAPKNGAVQTHAKREVPVLGKIPIINFMFKNKSPASRGFSAQRVKLDALVRFVNGFLEPKLVDGEEVKSLGKGNLLALATPDKLAWITRFLKQNRARTTQHIEVETRFITIPKSVFKRFIEPKLAKGSRIASGKPEGKGVAAMLQEAPKAIHRYALLADRSAREKLLIQLYQNKAATVVNAPKLTTLPLTRASLLLGNRTSYVKDFEVEIVKGKAIANPVIDVVVSGLLFECTVALLEDDVVGMDFEYSLSNLKRPIKKVTTRLAHGGAPITIQLPELTMAKLASRVELSKDQTALFAMETGKGEYVVAMLLANATKKPKDK